MITRDHIVRQIQQLSQVLAAVLFHKRAGREEDAQEALAQGLQRSFGLPLTDLDRFGKGEILALCQDGDAFSSEKALALADLLREGTSPAARERALWLYEAVQDAGDLAPLDLPERIAALRGTP